MQEILSTISEKDELSDLCVALMYAKDILVCRSIGEATEETLKGIIGNPPTESEIKQIIIKRQKESKFNKIDMFYTGKMKLAE